jgi:hypothetical protein
MVFLSPAVSVSVTRVGQRVLVNASRVFGSTNGADLLTLYICWASGSSAPMRANTTGLSGLSVPPNTRLPFSLSAIVSGFQPGATYQVGLCGTTSNLNWNDNGVGYTTAIVF